MYKNILHATDLSGNHFDICKQAQEIAHRFGSQLYLLHVIEPPATLQLAQGLGFAEFDQPIKDDAEAVMKILGEAVSVPVERQFVEVGSIKMHILEKVKALHCDLIIIGSRSPSSFPGFLGSTTHAMIYHAPCDVLTLRVNNTD